MSKTKVMVAQVAQICLTQKKLIVFEQFTQLSDEERETVIAAVRSSFGAIQQQAGPKGVA